MKKNDVFTFTAPNGADVQAVAIRKLHELCDVYNGHLIVEYWLCYAQNRLFIWNERTDGDSYCAEIVVDYAILPDYDNMLELHQAMEYPTWEQNMEKPDPDEDEDVFWDSCAEEHNKQEDV